MGNCQSSSARRAVLVDNGYFPKTRSDNTVDQGDHDNVSPKLLLDSWKAAKDGKTVYATKNDENNKKGTSPTSTHDMTEASLTDHDMDFTLSTPGSIATTPAVSSGSKWLSPNTTSLMSVAHDHQQVHYTSPSLLKLEQHSQHDLRRPLSPTLSLLPPQRQQSVDRQQQQHQQQTSSSSTSLRRKQGRALKARLEKARGVQRALSSQTLHLGPDHDFDSPGHDCSNSSGDANLSCTSSGVSTDGSSSHVSSPSKDHNPLLLQRHNIKLHATANDKSQANAEFEASFARGMFWGEIEQDAKVSAVALSYSPGASSSPVDLFDTDDEDSSPYRPLLLAVGTEDGTVTVSHILSSQSTISSTNANAATDTSASAPASPNCHKRLGPCATWKVDTTSSCRVRSIDFSSDGKFLAIGGDDCCCTILQIFYEEEKDNDDGENNNAEDCFATATTVSVSIKHAIRVRLAKLVELPRVDRVYAVKFRPGGRHLGVAGFDGVVAIYDTLRDFQLVEEITRDGLIFCLDWSHDGRYLAFGGSDKCCAIVNATTSWRVCKEIRRPCTVTCLKWYPTPHKSHLAIGGSNATVAIVDCRNQGSTIINCSIQFEVDCNQSDDDANIKGIGSKIIASPKSLQSLLGTVNCSQSGAGGGLYKVHALCWSPNGTYLVVCGSNQRCTLFETKSFTQVHEVRQSQDITCAVWGQQNVLAGVPPRYLVLGSDDKKILLLKAGLELNASGSVTGDDLSSNSSSSFAPISANNDWKLKENVFLDVDANVDICNISTTDVHDNDSATQTVVTLAFSNGSKSRSSTFFAYSLDDGRTIIRSTIGDWRVVAELRFAKPITSIAFSNGSRFLVLGSHGDSRIYVVETSPSWSVIWRNNFFAPVNTVGFSKYNERLAVGTDDGVLKLLDPKSNYEAACQIDVSESGILSIDWSSRNFALGRRDGSVTLYDASQVTQNLCVPVVDLVHHSSVQGLAFGPSSRFLAVAENKGFISLYSAKGGWVLCHQINTAGANDLLRSGISTLSWNASGQFLAYGSENGNVQMVDTAFWAEVEELSHLLHSNESTQEHSLQHASVAFSQDGNMFAFSCIYGDGAKVIDTHQWKLSSFSHSSQNLMADESVMSV